MNLVNFDINAHWGRHGISKEGGQLLIQMFLERLDQIETKSEEAKRICGETRHELSEFKAVKAATENVGCAPVLKLQKVAVSAFIISSVHAVYDLFTHIGHWAKS